MSGIGPGSNRGGSSATPGPADNIFGTTSGDLAADPFTLQPATNRAAAESVRNTYFQNNPTKLQQYDDEQNFYIVLFFDDSGNTEAIGQVRLGSAWVDDLRIIAIQGRSGAATDFSGVGGPNRIPAIGGSPNFDPGDSGLRAENEILYFGEIDTDLTMRIRRDNTDGFLYFERYNGTSWEEIFQMSNSATVDIVHFTESTGPVSVVAGQLCLYNRRIRDDQGTEILRPFLTDGTNVFPAVGSLPDGSVRIIQNLSDVMADPTNVNASYKTITFNEDLAAVATSGNYNDLSNQPDIGVTLEDEGTALTGITTTLNFVGDGVTVSGSGNRKVITIAGGSGGTTPTPGPDDFRYGRSQQSDPALVDFASLTDVASPTDPQTVSTGTTVAGDYFHIFSAASHTVQTITDTVNSEVVYQDGASDNIFTKTANARTENSVIYDAYTVGPLNVGVNEEYIVEFS